MEDQVVQSLDARLLAGGQEAQPRALAAIASWSSPRPSSCTEMTRVFPSRRASSVIRPRRACPRDALLRRLDAVPDGVADDVQQRLERLVLDGPVEARLLADHHHVDLPPLDPGRVVGHPDQALEQAPDRHDPDRLELVPELDRQPARGHPAVVGQGNGRGPGRLGQDREVVGQLGQPAQLAGDIGRGIEPG